MSPAKKPAANKPAAKKTGSEAASLGAPVLLERDPSLPLVELSIAARSGSQLDPPGREGGLALALRSLRRGAGSRGAHAIDEEVDRLGAEFGASTDACNASVHVTVLRRNFERMMALLTELLLRPTFPPDEVAQVVRETRADLIDSRSDDRTLAARFFRRHLFAEHPYGRPPSGTLATLESLTRDDAVRAYEATLVRDNLVFAASGDVTREALEQALAPLRAGLRDAPPPPNAVPEPKAPRGRRLLLIDKPGRTQCQIYIGGLGTHARDRDHTALQVGNTIFGGTFTARLMREVRSKRGWSYGASSRLGRDRAREAWFMWTFPAARDAAACVALQLGLLEKLLAEGVTEREVSFAKSYLARSHAFELDTASKRVGLALDEQVSELPRGYHSEYLERLRAVTRDEVNAALRRRLSSEDLWISIVATASELRAPLEKAIARLRETRVVPFDLDALPKR